MATTRGSAKAAALQLVPTGGRDLLFGRLDADRHYPGDPRFADSIRLLPEYISSLGKTSSSDAYLSDNLLDILLKEGAGKPPPLPADGSVDKPLKFLGSTLSLGSMVSYVEALDEYERKKAKFDVSHILRKIRRMKFILANIFDLTGVKDQQLILPIVESKHFFVVLVNFNKRTSSETSEKFITDIIIYDSLVGTSRRDRGSAKEHKQSVLGLVKVINGFVNKYLLADRCNEILRQTDDELGEKLDFFSCPQQRNDIDCGLFCVGIVLHLLDDHAVDDTIFSNADMSEMRKRLYVHFSRKVVKKSYKAYKHMIQQPTSVVVRESYPSLRGVPRLCDVVGPAPVPLPVPAPSPPGGRRDEGLVQQLEGTISSPVGTVSSPPSSLDASCNLVVDDDFHSLFPDKTVVLACLDDIEPIVRSYEGKTGLRLCIWKSRREKYRYYKCKSHVNCPFEIRLGRRRSDGFFRVRVHNNSHTKQLVPSLASDGRKYKSRRAGTLDTVIEGILNTKKDPPTPGDILHSTKGEKLPYMSAWRALNVRSVRAREEDDAKYQLVMPYVEEFRRINPGAVAGYTRDDDKLLVDVYFFPPFMNGSLRHVRPVICLDAAHLNSPEKGTLYVASCLSGANEIYPIGFLISKGNEDGATWTKMLRLLYQACPSLSVHEPTLDVRRYTGEEYGTQNHAFLFMSDRDKGLQPALAEVFPNNIAMSCAMHIKSNVAQRFGQASAREIITIAKTYSARYAAHLVNEVRRHKPEAAEYIDDITDLWKSSQWMQPQFNPLNRTVVMPPRYGIVTSNTSESVNSMFKPARDVNWMDCVDTILDIMSTRISTLQMKWKDVPKNKVIGAATEVKIRYDASDSCSVSLLPGSVPVFKVTDRSVTGSAAVASVVVPGVDETPVVPEVIPVPTQLGARNAVHTVTPLARQCTCGVWQDYLVPCRHACAVLKQEYHLSWDDIQNKHVHPYYTCGSLHELYSNNIFPVCMDNLEHDGLTLPPQVRVRSAGRPRIKRLRRRSEYADPSESKIHCSACNQPGHNKRTCTAIVGTL